MHQFGLGGNRKQGGTEFTQTLVCDGFLIADFGFLAACAMRSLTGVSPVFPEARQQSLYFATQRSFDQTGNTFGESRFDERHYGIIYVAEGDNFEFGQFVTQPTVTDWIARCERR